MMAVTTKFQIHVGLYRPQVYAATRGASGWVWTFMQSCGDETPDQSAAVRAARCYAEFRGMQYREHIEYAQPLSAADAFRADVENAVHVGQGLCVS